MDIAGVVSHNLAVFTVGETAPAMSISWAPPAGPIDSGFVVIYSELDPGDEHNDTPTTTVCLNCLIDDGDEQIARGLDLARRFAQVDWDVDAGDWFVPRDAAAAVAEELIDS